MHPSATTSVLKCEVQVVKESNNFVRNANGSAVPKRVFFDVTNLAGNSISGVMRVQHMDPGIFFDMYLRQHKKRKVLFEK